MVERTRLVWYPVWIGAALAFTVIGLIYAIVKWLSLRSVKYEVNETRIAKSEGVVFKKVESVNLEEISYVGVKQNGFEKAAGFGDVYVGKDSGSGVVLRFVRNPHVVLAFIKGTPRFKGNVISS